MCCLIRSVLKCAICVINGLLGAAFLIVALLGVLLKAAPQIYDKLLSLLAPQIPRDDVKEILKFLGENAGSAAVVLILVGGCVGVFCFFGLFAVNCNCEKAFKVYTAILGVLVVAEAIGVGYFFGDPDAIPEKVNEIMNKSLAVYGKAGAQYEGATLMWNYLMTSNESYCCGLAGYTNFTDKQDLPKACCAKNNTSPDGCTVKDAQTANVPGCQTKIDTFLVENKNLFLVAPVILVVFQAGVFALDLFAICTHAI